MKGHDFPQTMKKTAPSGLGLTPKDRILRLSSCKTSEAQRGEEIAQSHVWQSREPRQGIQS